MLPTIDVYSQGIGNGVAPVRRPEAEKPAEAEKALQAEKRQQSQEVREQAIPAKEPKREDQDKAELKFSLTREEREAFLAAFESKQDPARMSEEEKDLLQHASERISEFIDNAIARNAESRERVEKAVSEWYSRFSHGEPRSAGDLIDLLRKAAMGNLSEFDKA